MNKPIFSITEAAEKRLKQLTLEKPNAIGIKIEVVSGGCSGFSYKLDHLYDKDDFNYLLVTYPNFLLAIDKASELYLFGTELDYVNENFGKKFLFRNPQAKAKCGCGKSFGI